jgi:hypothetical protein
MRALFTSVLLLSAFTCMAEDGYKPARKSTMYRNDIGFNFGLANYLGEIGGKEKTEQPFIWDMKLRETRWAFGGFYRYKLNDYVSLRGDFIYGRIQGDDAYSENPGRVGRNLSFRNDMLELSARTEIYLLNIADVGNRGWYKVDFKSYAFAGIGAAFHEPKTLYQGEWVKLRPLQTEGVAYNKVIATMPLGLGFFFTYKRQHRFGWEMGWRMTFTDYLDDISTVYRDPSDFNGNTMAISLANRTEELSSAERPDIENYKPGSKRGDPTDNDTYVYTTFSYSYVLRSKKYDSFYRPQRFGDKKVRIKFEG